MFSLSTALLLAGVWSIETKADPITDDKTVFIYLIDEEKSEALSLRCDAKDTSFSITVVSNDYLGDRPVTRPATMRLDKGEPYVSKWGFTRNAAVSQTPEAPLMLMRAKSTAAFRFEKSVPGSKDFVFDISAGQPMIAQFKQRCAAIGVPVPQG